MAKHSDNGTGENKLSMKSVPLGDIKVGKRARKSVGDLTALMESMRNLGQLQPILLNSELQLIAGERRFRSAQNLGWKNINAVIATDYDTAIKALEAERDENTARLDFTPTEKLNIIREIESMLAPLGAAHKGKGKGGEAPVNTRAAAAAAAGAGPEQADRIRKIGRLADADPDKFGDLPDMMDKESVNAAWKAAEARGGKAVLETLKDATREEKAKAKGKKPPAKKKSKAREVKDRCGNVVPDYLRDVFAENTPQSQMEESLRGVARTLKTVVSKFNPHVPVGDMVQPLVDMADQLKANRPHCLCPNCQGEDKARKKCEKVCAKTGFFTHAMYTAALEKGEINKKGHYPQEVAAK